MDEKPSSCDPKPHVVVLGGGLAGMAAACSLLDSGYGVTLVERRPFLGGRAFSFFYPFHGRTTDDARGDGLEISQTSEAAPITGAQSQHETAGMAGCQVDNGQHVFLGCCSYYIDFLKKLGTLDKSYLQHRLNVRVVSPPKNGRKGKSGAITAAPILPAPFHMLPSFLRFPHLGFRDKVLAIYGLTRIILTNRHNPQLESQSFYEWLKAHGQTERAIVNFWNLLILPTLNDDIRDVSAAMGLMVYQEGVLKSRTSANVGYSRVGLSKLMGESAQQYILGKGGRLLLGQRVSGLIMESSGGGASTTAPEGGRLRLEGVELDGDEVIRGDMYVSALPFQVFTATLPTELLEEPFFRGTKEISSSPIVNIHVWYDRPVMDSSSTEFVASLDSPLQWVFDKGRILGSNEGGHGPASGLQGQYICISVSGAWDYINRSKEEIRKIFLEAMEEVFPKAAEAEVEHLLVVKSSATFRCTPGATWLRPATETPVENLLLAGDWTDTGWPSTMEGAVKSGVEAAKAIKSRASSG